MLGFCWGFSTLRWAAGVPFTTTSSKQLTYYKYNVSTVKLNTIANTVANHPPHSLWGQDTQHVFAWCLTPLVDCISDSKLHISHLSLCHCIEAGSNLSQNYDLRKLANWPQQNTSVSLCPKFSSQKLCPIMLSTAEKGHFSQPLMLMAFWALKGKWSWRSCFQNCMELKACTHYNTWPC